MYAEQLGKADIEGISVTVKILPVNPDGIQQFMHYLLEHWRRYDLVIMLGVAAESSAFRIELLAHHSTLSFPDIDGPSILPTTLGLTMKHWLPYLSHYSYDAGTYFCNDIYYSTLHFIYNQACVRPDGHLLPAVFVHVPQLDTIPISQGLEFLKQFLHDINKN